VVSWDGHPGRGVGSEAHAGEGGVVHDDFGRVLGTAAAHLFVVVYGLRTDTQRQAGLFG
jgi:hypothetical protein